MLGLAAAACGDTGGAGAGGASTTSTSGTGGEVGTWVTSTERPSALIVPGRSPYDVFVRVRGPGVTCADPAGAGLEGVPYNQVDINLGPSHAQTLGVRPLGTETTHVLAAYTACNTVTSACELRGFGLDCADATIEITSIDKSGISFVLAGVSSCPVSLDSSLTGFDGAYTAARCDTIRATAIAVPSSTGPGDLTIWVGYPAITCDVPKAGDAYGSWESLEIPLPVGSQANGSYPLKDVASHRARVCSLFPEGCWDTWSPALDGKIKITAIDDTQITFTLYNPPGNFAGTYTAPRCP